MIRCTRHPPQCIMINSFFDLRMSEFFLLVLLGCLPNRSSAQEVLYEQKIQSNSLPIIVPTVLDGEVISMILDTGASVYSVDTSIQPHLHHYLKEEAAGATDSDFRAKVWESPTMSVGNWKLPHGSVVAIDFTAVRSAIGLDIRGFSGGPSWRRRPWK
jgi:hypothetical protein